MYPIRNQFAYKRVRQNRSLGLLRNHAPSGLPLALFLPNARESLAVLLCLSLRSRHRRTASMRRFTKFQKSKTSFVFLKLRILARVGRNAIKKLGDGTSSNTVYLVS